MTDNTELARARTHLQNYMAPPERDAIEALARLIVREEIARSAPSRASGLPPGSYVVATDGTTRTSSSPSSEPAQGTEGAGHMRSKAVADVVEWCHKRIAEGKTASSYGADIECLRNFINDLDGDLRTALARIAELEWDIDAICDGKIKTLPLQFAERRYKKAEASLAELELERDEAQALAETRRQTNVELFDGARLEQQARYVAEAALADIRERVMAETDALIGVTMPLSVSARVINIRDIVYRRVGEARILTTSPTARDTDTPAPAPKDGCDCFGDTGLHASTHVPIDADRLHCDLCGKPVSDDSTDVLSAVNSTPAPTVEPLVWVEHASMAGVWFSEGALVRYSVSADGWSHQGVPWAELIAADSIEAGKAAAQADYETRVRAALAPLQGGTDVKAL